MAFNCHFSTHSDISKAKQLENNQWRKIAATIYHVLHVATAISFLSSDSYQIKPVLTYINNSESIKMRVMAKSNFKNRVDSAESNLGQVRSDFEPTTS